MLTAYERNRMGRARTVQTIAHLISVVGQIDNPPLEKTRNTLMRMVPSFLGEWAFDKSVRFSLGWNYRPKNI